MIIIMGITSCRVPSHTHTLSRGAKLIYIQNMDIQKCEKIWEIKPQNYNLLLLLMCGQATDQQTEEWGRVPRPSRLECASLQEEPIHHGDHTVSILSSATNTHWLLLPETSFFLHFVVDLWIKQHETN